MPIPSLCFMLYYCFYVLFIRNMFFFPLFGNVYTQTHLSVKVRSLQMFCHLVNAENERSPFGGSE